VLSVIKKFVIDIDTALTGKFVTRYAGYIVTKTIVDQCECRWRIGYHKNERSLLATLCDKYGSDKGSLTDKGHPYPFQPHSYADFYSCLFDHCRFTITHVFECGIGTNNPKLPSSMGPKGIPGASLRVWRDYFPNAQIIGADIDRAILFKEERIRTFYVDQTSRDSVVRLAGDIGTVDFDFMLDDGLHEFDAGICLFENIIGHLSNTGIYIIEDVSLADCMSYNNYFSKTDYDFKLVNVDYRGLNSNSSNLIVIRHKQFDKTVVLTKGSP
jgi:hypothetical protein